MNFGIRRFACVKLMPFIRNSILKRGLLTHPINSVNKCGCENLVQCLAIPDRNNVPKFMAISGTGQTGDRPVRSSISDPVVVPNVEIGIPISVVIRDFELPTIKKHELFDPIGNVIEKKAHKMMRIRKKKMKKHKWKKLQKRMKFVFAKIKRKRDTKKEAIFKEEVNNILMAGESFNPELELNEKIKILNAEKPINRVRGYFSPKWVVDEYLEQQKKQKMLDEKVAICLKKM